MNWCLEDREVLHQLDLGSNPSSATDSPEQTFVSSFMISNNYNELKKRQYMKNAICMDPNA